MNRVAVASSIGLLLVSMEAGAAFIPADFELSATGFDAILPAGPPDGPKFGPTFALSLKNVGDRPAIFDANIFLRGSASLVTIDGIEMRDSMYYEFDFSPISPEATSVLPGASIGFGGLSITLARDTPPGTRIVLESLEVSLSNDFLGMNPTESDVPFSVTALNLPVVAVVTPIPAVGMLVLPAALVLCRRAVARQLS